MWVIKLVLVLLMLACIITIVWAISGIPQHPATSSDNSTNSSSDFSAEDRFGIAILAGIAFCAFVVAICVVSRR
jgi:hypothetical protein